MKAKISDEQLLQERMEGMTLREIAEKYDMHIRSVEARSAKLSKAGHFHGNRYVTHHVPEGYAVKGTSTMIRANGEEVVRWVKTDIDREKVTAMMQAAMDAFCEDVPRAEAIEPVKADRSDTLTFYPVFDLHIGALAHKHECGENYSTDLAEKVMNEFFDYSIKVAPDSKKAIMCIGGDFLHSDGLTAVTPASGHVLDQDSRYAKLVHVGIRSVRRAVDKLLRKHDAIELKIIPGNHDESGMIWLRAAMAAFYEDEPRVSVDTSPAIMHVYHFGQTLLGFTHGHTMKKADTRLCALAADHSKDFGNSKYRYTHSGHWHHQTVTEHSLGIDEVHGQLGAKDAYSASGGWRSYRQAAVIVYHPEFGEIGRHTYKPGM